MLMICKERNYTMNKNILIIDDDKEIVELLAVYLRNEGYNIYKAYDGDEALQKVSTYEVDLMILDIMMPKRNGLEVCQEVRENNTVPILMLSAKAEDMDKILGLMTGADDYMIKPFNPLELVARGKLYYEDPLSKMLLRKRMKMVLFVFALLKYTNIIIQLK